MRQSRAIDVSTGLFVLLGMTAILFLVTQITNREFAWGDESYRLTAQFENIGALKAGAPVSMAGVTIGRVESIGYDMQAFKADVTLRIDARYDRIPNDSDASIYTAGLLGGQYVGLTPGNAEDVYHDGDQVEFVQDAIRILQGQLDIKPPPTFKVPLSSPIRKVPGRTEFQRGILARGSDGAWTVRPTGEQGSGILKSMSEANCFIILGDAVGNVEPGTVVEVQYLEGMV